MGSIVMGLVGGVGGFLVGGPSGALLGFSLGMTAGNMLFPVTTTLAAGPRLNSLTVTTSTYGAAVPWGMGTVRLGGNVFWAMPLREQTNKVKTGGKGGGGATQQTTYSYFGTFALGLAEGPALYVTRIWANSTLVYDITPGSSTVCDPSFAFTFYPGDEEQLPDPIMQAALGAGMCPAFRGLCYLLFKDIPLANYSNALPQLSVELVFANSIALDPTVSVPFIKRVPDLYTPTANSDAVGLAVDWTGRTAYVQGVATATPTDPTSALVVVDLAALAISSTTPWSAITTDGAAVDGLYVGPDDALYGLTPQGSRTGVSIVRIDPIALRETARNSSASYSSEGGWGSTATPLAGLSLRSSASGHHDFLLWAHIAGGNLFGLLHLPDMTTFCEWNLPPLPITPLDLDPNTTPVGAAMGLVGTDKGEAWLIEGGHGATATLRLRKVCVTATKTDAGVERMTASITAFVIAPSDILPPFGETPGAVLYVSDPTNLVYDATDNTLTFWVSVYTQPGEPTYMPPTDRTAWRLYLVKWSETAGLIHAVPLLAPLTFYGPQPQFGQGYSSSQPQGQYIMALIGTSVVTIDTGTDTDIGIIGNAPMGCMTQAFDVGSSTIFMLFTDGTWGSYKTNRFSVHISSVQAILDGIFARAGLSIDQYDNSQLANDTVDGYLLSSADTAANMIAPLAQAFLFNPAEIDGKIVCVKRGGPVVATITEDGLVRQQATDSTPEPYTATRAQEIDLPAVLTLTYLDPNMADGQNAAQASRNRGPDPTMASQNMVAVTLPALISADRAAQSVEQQLVEAWIARLSYSMMLGPDLLHLTPTDPVTLALNNGLSARVRLATADLGADFSTQVTLLSEIGGQYVSTKKGADATPAQIPSVPDAARSTTFLLDLPLLRDADAAAVGSLRCYWLAAPLSDAAVGWPGEALDMSPASVPEAWIAQGVETTPATWGVGVTALPDPVSTCRYDGGSVTVRFCVGEAEIGAISDAALLAGGNVLAAIKADGTIEVFQFRDAVLLSPGTFVLSTLLRGRRGTDTMAYGHGVGERMVLLTVDAAQGLLLPMSALGTVRWFRATTLGTAAAGGTVISLVSCGRDQMPYAPVHVAGAWSGGDIVLTWVRRTRLGGDWLNASATVPLSEATEAYEVDILAGGVVLRTLKASAPTATYLAAQIAVDLGGHPSSLTLAVYQMSATVGRGFARATTVEIA